MVEELKHDIINDMEKAMNKMSKGYQVNLNSIVDRIYLYKYTVTSSLPNLNIIPTQNIQGSGDTGVGNFTIN